MDGLEDEEKQDQPWPVLKAAGRYFTRFFMAISLINLFDDLNMVKIRSQVLGWIDSYKHLVEAVGDFLFGWADFLWIAMTHVEQHLLMICVYLMRAFTAQTFRFIDRYPDVVAEEKRDSFERGANAEAVIRVIIAAVVAFPIIVIMLLLPTAASLVVVGVPVAITAVSIAVMMASATFGWHGLVGKQRELGLYGVKLLAEELIHSVMIAAALVILDRVFAQVF